MSQVREQKPQEVSRLTQRVRWPGKGKAGSKAHGPFCCPLGWRVESRSGSGIPRSIWAERLQRPVTLSNM